MKSVIIFRIVFLLAACLLGSAVVRAQDLGAVKARMEQRLPSLNALKDRGAAGENNRGYVEARGNASGGDQQIISDENSDRRTVYSALAAQTGANADAVGRQRAQQLASIAHRGWWVQDAGGEWRQKG